MKKKEMKKLIDELESTVDFFEKESKMVIFLINRIKEKGLFTINSISILRDGSGIAEFQTETGERRSIKCIYGEDGELYEIVR